MNFRTKVFIQTYKIIPTKDFISITYEVNIALKSSISLFTTSLQIQWFIWIKWTNQALLYYLLEIKKSKTCYYQFLALVSLMFIMFFSRESIQRHYSLGNHLLLLFSCENPFSKARLPFHSVTGNQTSLVQKRSILDSPRLCPDLGKLSWNMIGL